MERSKILFGDVRWESKLPDRLVQFPESFNRQIAYQTRGNKQSEIVS